MTDDEIEKISQRIAYLVVEKMPDMKIEIIDDEQEWKFTLNEEDEQSLLSQLAQAMTELDYNLKLENYLVCEEIKSKIAKIENQLKNYK